MKQIKEVQLEEIVFYDGSCGFCSRVVQFILLHERNSRLHFSAIDTPFSKKFFQEKGLEEVDPNTFYFYINGRFFMQSQGVIQLSKFLKFPFSLFRLLVIIPPFMRDAAYSFVAKRRKRLVGNFCVVPNENQIMRFLN